MHALQIIGQSLNINDTDFPSLEGLSKTQGLCCITGIYGDCYDRKAVIGKSFTNLDLLSNSQSNLVNCEAFIALKYKWQRMSSYTADGKTFNRLDRIGVRNAVFNPPKSKNWVGYATTSYKKHGGLNTPVNNSESNFWLFETVIVDCGLSHKQDWWHNLNNYLRMGIGRSILESLDAPTHAIKKIGIKNYLDFLSWAEGKSNTPLYQFLCYLLPSQDELKAEKNELIQKTN